MYAIIKVIKKQVITLYKKSYQFMKIKHLPNESSSFGGNKSKNFCSVYFKDVITEKQAYIQFARKLCDLHESLMNKCILFRMASKLIFPQNPQHHYIESDAIFKGFFFLFVYKGFIIREIITRIKECLPNDKNLKQLD